MKRKIKQGSTLYAYLDKLGLLTQGTDAEIARAKRQYWNHYKQQWRKAKRKRCKAVTVYFEQREFKAIRQAAQRHTFSPARFMKVAALTCATNPTLITTTIVGMVRELLYQHYNTLQQICTQRNVGNSTQEELLTTTLEDEEKILSLLLSH